MQVDPVKPTLKALGTKRLRRLKLESDVLSSFAFKFNLRRYSVEHIGLLYTKLINRAGKVAYIPNSAMVAYKVGRCSLTQS